MAITVGVRKNQWLDGEKLYFGDDQDYWFEYDPNNTEFQLWTSDGDGSGTDTKILSIDDGDIIIDVEDDINFPNATGTPTFLTHDHSEGGMSTVPNGGLTNSSVTVAGNSVSLGGSTAISIDDLSDVLSNTESAGEIPIWHGTNSQYENATLTGGDGVSITNADASVTITVDTGSSGGLKFSGGQLVVEPADFAGSGLQDDGSDNLELVNNSVTITAGDGLKNGGSVSLGGTVTIDIEPADFAGQDLADDGSDNLAFQRADFLVDNPELFPRATLDDTESIEVDIPVPNGETLTIYRWGVHRTSDDTAPTSLEVQLLDETDTAQTTANTTDAENTAGITSLTNSSGSLVFYTIRLINNTGSSEDVAGHYAYEVS